MGRSRRAAASHYNRCLCCLLKKNRLFLGSFDGCFTEFLHSLLDFERSLASACAGSFVSLFGLKSGIFCKYCVSSCYFFDNFFHCNDVLRVRGYRFYAANIQQFPQYQIILRQKARFLASNPEFCLFLSSYAVFWSLFGCLFHPGGTPFFWGGCSDTARTSLIHLLFAVSIPKKRANGRFFGIETPTHAPAKSSPTTADDAASLPHRLRSPVITRHNRPRRATFPSSSAHPLPLNTILIHSIVYRRRVKMSTRWCVKMPTR